MTPIKGYKELDKYFIIMNLKNKIIESNRILLKPITLDDVTEKYCSWLNNEKINHGLVTKKISLEELNNYVKQKITSNNCVFFTISIKLEKNLIHIGNIKLEPIDLDNKIATLGILIGESKYHGKGIGTEVIKQIIDFLKQHNFKKIILGVEKENIAAINLYTKIGFDTYEETKTCYKMQYTI